MGFTHPKDCMCHDCLPGTDREPSAASAGYGTDDSMAIAEITKAKFAEDAIRLMIEYRDIHGYEEEYAITLAVRDMSDPAAQVVVVP